MNKHDVIIYAPLEEEYKGIQIRFIPDEEVSGKSYIGFVKKLDSNIDMLVVHGFEWGNDAAYEVMNEVFASHDCKLAICLGIGGAISGDAKLGDVFYSREVLDLTQRQKIEKDANGNSRIKYDPKTYPSSIQISKTLDRSRLSISGTSNFRKWQDDCEFVNRGTLVKIDTFSLGHPAAHFERPFANNGKIAATNTVLADSQAVEDVRLCGRKMSCVDTESAGFTRACSGNQNVRNHIVIRAISDLADETKKITEEQFKKVFREIATSNATLFLKHNIESMIEAADPGITTVPKIENSKENTIEDAIEKNEVLIKGELSKRSVAFKAIQNEQKMPVPRMRQTDLMDETGAKKMPPELEIEEVLSTFDRVVVELPPHYPDSALPWLFAHLLTEANIGGRFTIPVFVNWNRFGPPNNDLDAQLVALGLIETKNNKNYNLVFVFPDFKVSSRTKSKFLASCIENFDNASVLIFPDRNELGVYDNELEKIVHPSTFQIEGISFSSISQFMSANFELPLEESEVIAARLISTFRNYNLKVNPTYLAAIQKSTVTSFIDANQRGELIELAVYGLLSILVADDTSDVRLGRTTRERFLSDLAVSVYCQKNSYTRNQLENYVDEYAVRMGFDIRAGQFIDVFINNGILAFENNRVDIPTPVIRSYMLAKGLLDKPDEARRYFDLQSSYFDFSTFDLYAEFSVDPSLYDNVISSLTESIDFFTNKQHSYDVVLKDGKYKSYLLTKTLNLDEVSEDIKKQSSDLVEVTSMLSEKQAHLDVQSEIALSQTAQKVDVSDKNAFKNEHISVVQFEAASILLGAAAEKIEDKTKVALITKIIELGELIITDLLTIYSSFDVKVAASEVFEQIRENDELELHDENAERMLRKYIELMAADWEFRQAIHPVFTLLSVLCEASRTNVLLSPLKRTSTNNDLQEFLRTAWIFDMDPISQKVLSKNLSKKIGNATFLRIVFATFIINRIYWYHSEREIKSALASGIDEMLKPLALKNKVDLDDDDSKNE